MTYQPPNEPGDSRQPGAVTTTTPGARSNQSPSPPTERAQATANEAGQQAKEVVGEAKDQAREVVSETRDQARQLMDQAQSELRGQAETQTQRAASNLRTLGHQLGALSAGRVEQAGPLVDYMSQAQTKVNTFAERLDRQGVDGVLSDVSRFARRRPGTFLLACAGAGFVLARMVRSQSGQSMNGNSSASTWSPNREMPTQSELGMDPYARPITSQWEGRR
jgi:hypothetical protein